MEPLASRTSAAPVVPLYAEENGAVGAAPRTSSWSEVDVDALGHIDACPDDNGEEDCVTETPDVVLPQYIAAAKGMPESAWGDATVPGAVEALDGQHIVQVACSVGHAIALTRLCGDSSFSRSCEYDPDDPEISGMLCPITGELMHDPVKIAGEAEGRVYEREAIDAWLSLETARLSGAPPPSSALLTDGAGVVSPLTGELICEAADAGNIELLPQLQLRQQTRSWQHAQWSTLAASPLASPAAFSLAPESPTHPSPLMTSVMVASLGSNFSMLPDGSADSWP